MRKTLLMLSWLLGGTLYAQQSQVLFDQYCREAGDHAELFSGKVERGYSPTVYMNHPYWLFDHFIPGEVIYKGVLYKRVTLRYDAYLKQLVVNTPEKHTNVWVEMPNVESFKMGGTDYVRHNGEFVARLVHTSRMDLMEQVHCTVKEEVSGKNTSVYTFDRKVKYFLVRNGQSHEVTNLKSVQKLFPGRKRELKRYAKEKMLDFKQHRQSALIMVTKYANQLLEQPLN